jgi:nicotinamidase-related amidase
MERPALLALHLQNDVLHQDGKLALGLARQPERRQTVLTAASMLFAAARAASIPLIHVRIAFSDGYSEAKGNGALFEAVRSAGALREGTWGAEFHAGVDPLPGEVVLTHANISGFRGCALERHLERTRRHSLILCGVATNSSVEHTGRDAADIGFDVIVSADACGSGREDLHAAALENLRLVGRVSSLADLLSAMELRYE